MRQKEINVSFNQKERVMKDVTIIGIDIAKNFIQIHGADHRGKAVFKKRLAKDKSLIITLCCFTSYSKSYCTLDDVKLIN